MFLRRPIDVAVQYHHHHTFLGAPMASTLFSLATETGVKYLVDICKEVIIMTNMLN
jgi:hypothetical protein